MKLVAGANENGLSWHIAENAMSQLGKNFLRSVELDSQCACGHRFGEFERATQRQRRTSGRYLSLDEIKITS